MELVIKSFLQILLLNTVIFSILGALFVWLRVIPRPRINFFKRIFGIDSEEVRIGNAIKRSSAKVVGRGTVMINPDKVRNSQKFKDNSKLARDIVENNK